MANNLPPLSKTIDHLYDALNTLEDLEKFIDRVTSGRYNTDLGVGVKSSPEMDKLHSNLMCARAVLVRRIVEKSADLAAVESSGDD